MMERGKLLINGDDLQGIINALKWAKVSFLRSVVIFLTL